MPINEPTTSAPDSKNDSYPRWVLAWLASLAVVMCVVLRWMGRVLWCQEGDWRPWSFDVMSGHNSQHLFDPYALSHFEHGVGLWLLLGVTLGTRVSDSVRILIVAVIEAGWEILENTPMVIDRYREATVSLDYFGDSIANSTSDYVMCLAGVWLARKIDWRVGVGIIVALEWISLIWIRDSLLINIIMLIYPIEGIKEWQQTP